VLDALLAAFLIMLLALGANYAPSATHDLSGVTPALVQATLGDALVIARQTGASADPVALGTVADTGATLTVANVGINESLWTIYAGRPFSHIVGAPLHIAVVPFRVQSVLGVTPPAALLISPSGSIDLPAPGWTTSATLSGTVACPTAASTIVLLGANGKPYSVPIACNSFGGVTP